MNSRPASECQLGLGLFCSLLFPLFLLTSPGFLKESFSMVSSPLESKLSSSILMMGNALLLTPSWEPWAHGRESQREAACSGGCTSWLFPRRTPNLPFCTSSKSQGEKAFSLLVKTSGMLGILRLSPWHVHLKSDHRTVSNCKMGCRSGDSGRCQEPGAQSRPITVAEHKSSKMQFVFCVTVARELKPLLNMHTVTCINGDAGTGEGWKEAKLLLPRRR